VIFNEKYIRGSPQRSLAILIIKKRHEGDIKWVDSDQQVY